MNFSKEVAAQLQSYVYRLVDPRNGLTFYVGKGTGNRVFDHVKCALKVSSDTADDSFKYKTIRQIKAQKLDVISIIHRWGMSDEEAFEVESALIDAFPCLTNIQEGHDSDRGCTNADVIINTLGARIYEEPDFNYLIIKIKTDMILKRAEECSIDDFEQARYETTRSAWRIQPNNLEGYNLVFSVTDQIVREVYKIDRWKEHENRKGRFYFEGSVADETIRDKFVGKRIPEKYRRKGMSNPVLQGGN